MSSPTNPGTPSSPWRELLEPERTQWATDFTPHVVVEREQKIISASGACPACGHWFTVNLSENDLLLESVSLRSPRNWDGDLRFVLACSCNADHPGRPSANAFGCGASARFHDAP